MNKERANKVYDLLVSMGGAQESERMSFVYYHCEKENECNEWRFMGKLGFGGKYYSNTNLVSCYREDENQKRIEIINELNSALANVL